MVCRRDADGRSPLPRLGHGTPHCISRSGGLGVHPGDAQRRRVSFCPDAAVAPARLRLHRRRSGTQTLADVRADIAGRLPRTRLWLEPLHRPGTAMRAPVSRTCEPRLETRSRRMERAGAEVFDRLPASRCNQQSTFDRMQSPRGRPVARLSRRDGSTPACRSATGRCREGLRSRSRGRSATMINPRRTTKRQRIATR